MDDDLAGIDGIGEDEEREEEEEEEEKEEEEEEDELDASDDEIKKKFDEEDPMIDEDDFLEFFLKEALKLSPEEIEGYRSSPNKVDAKSAKLFEDSTVSETSFTDDDTDDEEWDAVEDELRKAGILPKEKLNDQEDLEVVQNFLQSLQTSGGMRGPAATLLNQMGVSVPNENDIGVGQSGRGSRSTPSKRTPPTKHARASKNTELTEINDEDPENDGNEAELYEQGYEDGKLAQLLEKMNSLKK
ncbi:hypothetical protein NADFUDRAFT_81754 [Nadsonia fulvescens var. elongata DSM 6958]|uniref:Uncharacterized protein n=1 Tax=Nadsonia fulvescens var. elongata DSM 6958 TaxID=857566 RepID=A0A1E3PPN3_9ASCO|nr:hypothetical protein NADFUDRAFT_81754 [Nadsonia fulvescens var. elongata DSM 6958]